jgi:ATP-binding cassette subfamily B protein
MPETKQKSAVRGDRVRALRNLPPLLRILWDSGPLVVTWGILLRIVVAFAPLGIAAVAAWIVNGVQGRMMGQELRPHFWWMVGLEVILAVTMVALLRVIDYLDSVLADRYTHQSASGSWIRLRSSI